MVSTLLCRQIAIIIPEEDPSGIETLQENTFGLSACEALHPLR